MAFACLATLAGGALAGCTFSQEESPYASQGPPPGAEDILEDVNLATLGLRAYPCSLFDAPAARCYASSRWLSVSEGKETLVRAHRELLDAGAQYWGSSASQTVGEMPPVEGLNLGCYFDYGAADYALRLVIVGPSGEGEPCVDDLPADGVTEVWIIGWEGDLGDLYGEVEIPATLEDLLESSPPPNDPAFDVFGGPSSSVEGYYGPELPMMGEGGGLHILEDTVTIRRGVVRGLVQYRGPVTESAAEDVVVTFGEASYEVRLAIRSGEAMPFEMPAAVGLDASALAIAPGWRASVLAWRGGLRLSGPTSNAQCGATAGEDGAPLPELIAPKGQQCLEFLGQATTLTGTWITVNAVVATFAEDGTVTDVFEPHMIRADGRAPGLGTVQIRVPDLHLAWLAPTGVAERTAVWIQYSKAEVQTSEGG